MPNSESSILEAALVGDPDPEIVSLETQIRRAQLDADTAALSELISDDLLFTGPDGNLSGKTQDLQAHASGAVRFREHSPEELRIRRIASNAAVTSLRSRLAVEVGGNVVRGVYRYTRVWALENGKWQVVGGHVSEVSRDS